MQRPFGFSLLHWGCSLTSNSLRRSAPVGMQRVFVGMQRPFGFSLLHWGCSLTSNSLLRSAPVGMQRFFGLSLLHWGCSLTSFVSPVQLIFCCTVVSCIIVDAAHFQIQPAPLGMQR
jgi:hypothetical protein